MLIIFSYSLWLQTIHIIVVCEPVFQTLWSHRKIKGKTVYHRWSEYQCRICNIQPHHWRHYINCIKCIHTVCIVEVVVIIIPYNTRITWCYIPGALRAALVTFGFGFIVVEFSSNDLFLNRFSCENYFLVYLLFICVKMINQRKM